MKIEIFGPVLWAILLGGTILKANDPTLFRASASCDAQAIASKLVGSDQSRHKNLCMMGYGFKRNHACEWRENLNVDACYSERWKFWVKEAMIAR